MKAFVTFCLCLVAPLLVTAAGIDLPPARVPSESGLLGATDDPIFPSSTTSKPTRKARTTTLPTTTEEPSTVPPTTTTVAPTTAAPTTTQAPTTAAPPTPSPTIGNWSWVDPVSGKRCVIVTMKIRLDFEYNTKTSGPKIGTVYVPSKAWNVSGSCTNETNTLAVFTDTTNFTMNFDKVQESYELSQLNFSVSTASLPDSTGAFVTLVWENATFETPLKNSYYCTKPQVFAVNETSSVIPTVANITVDHVQLEAFHEGDSYSFAAVRDCDSSKNTPDIVPLAVGLALASLVIVVLVAYLVARRRSQPGYMSM